MSVTRVQLVDSCGWLQNTHSMLEADVAKEKAVLIPPAGLGLGLYRLPVGLSALAMLFIVSLVVIKKFTSIATHSSRVSTD